MPTFSWPPELYDSIGDRDPQLRPRTIFSYHFFMYYLNHFYDYHCLNAVQFYTIQHVPKDSYLALISFSLWFILAIFYCYAFELTGFFTPTVSHSLCFASITFLYHKSHLVLYSLLWYLLLCLEQTGRTYILEFLSSSFVISAIPTECFCFYYESSSCFFCSQRFYQTLDTLQVRKLALSCYGPLEKNLTLW